MEKQHPSSAPRVSLGKKILVGSGMAMAAGLACAQSAGSVDVSAATSGLQQVATAVGEVGPLMVSAVAAGIVFKWVIAFLI
ncbi:major capsid protein [Xanthomonas massiliensis]|uniref:major capsid protein n=1 Tax=Xanthomonas massiliensis TaxID=1720302 RepID=UPI0008258B34|nr:major capsid protein [Xanthomonas massiliensis]